MSREPFKVGDKILHRFNPDLGPGRVEKTDGRRMIVKFPKTGAKLTLAANDSALKPLELVPGTRAKIEKSGEEVVVVEKTETGYRLEDGREATISQLWPLSIPNEPVERLAALEIDRAGAFRNRLDGIELSTLREARGLGSFLGGRVKLFPHQLHVSERATAADPVRWLLADEVGLGKTIEACLILSRLLRTNRADRTLVVAPSTLTVQWLGELYRKFHQTFVLLDRKRRDDVVKEHGRGFNPFEAHRRAVVALEDFVDDAKLTRQAEEAGLDLLVVDEAHRLERGRGEAGNDAYLAMAPLTRATTHLLLLSATPLEADTHGFFRLLELVRPDAYRSEDEFLLALEKNEPLPPCTSATRRVDIGGLPPRVPLPVDLGRAPVGPALTGDEKTDADDPRVEWLVEKAPLFAPGGAEEGKTLVFCHDMGTLASLKARLETATRRRVAIFHEELSPDRRDLEVAEFRRADGPLFLVSTECGGEGRNFEFCRRLVLFDMPTDPAQVEQRIGRLDRISRTTPVEIVYFRPPAPFERDLVTLYERIGLFTEPLGGLERSLSHVTAAIERTARLSGKGVKLPIEELVAEVREAARAKQRAVYHHLHSEGYKSEYAEAILSRVPAGLDDAMKRFVLDACAIHGLHFVERKGVKTFYVEFGSDALVEHLPGVAGGTRFLGTFDRVEAVEKEELEFFASGHPLVEGLFGELEDGSRGRVALVKLEGCTSGGDGLLFVHRKPEGGGYGTVAIDLSGRLRPEWAELLVARRMEVRGLKVDDWNARLEERKANPAHWPRLCRALARRAELPGPVVAAAAFRLMR